MLKNCVGMSNQCAWQYSGVIVNQIAEQIDSVKKSIKVGGAGANGGQMPTRKIEIVKKVMLQPVTGSPQLPSLSSALSSSLLKVHKQLAAGAKDLALEKTHLKQ